MRMLTSADPDYDEARGLFNQAIDKHPAVIAQCATPQTSPTPWSTPATTGYDVAVRAGGHSVSGLSTNDGGLVIDVRPMKRHRGRPRATARFGSAGV